MPLAHAHLLAFVLAFLGYKVGQTLQAPPTAGLTDLIAPHAQIHAFLDQRFSGNLGKVPRQLTEITKWKLKISWV